MGPQGAHMNLSDETIATLNRTLEVDGYDGLTAAIQALSAKQARKDGNVKLRHDGRTDRAVDNQGALLALSGTGKYYNGLFGDLSCFGTDPIAHAIKNGNAPPAPIGQRLVHCLEWLRINPGHLNHDVADAVKAELAQILVDNPALLHPGILLESPVGIKANPGDKAASDNALMSSLGAIVSVRNATLPRVSNLMRSGNRWAHAHPQAAAAAGKAETHEDDMKAVLSKRQRQAIKDVYQFAMNPGVATSCLKGILIEQDGGQKVRHISRPILNSMAAPAPELCASILEMDEIYRLMQGDNHGIKSFWDEIASVADLYPAPKNHGTEPASKAVKRLTGSEPVVFPSDESDPSDIGPNAAGRAIMMRRKLAASVLVASGIQAPVNVDMSFRGIELNKNPGALIESRRDRKPTWSDETHLFQVDNHLIHCVTERFLKEAHVSRQRNPLLPEASRAGLHGDIATQHYAGELLREIVIGIPARIFCSYTNADPQLIQHNVQALAKTLVQLEVVSSKEQAGWLIAKTALASHGQENAASRTIVPSANAFSHFIDALDHLGTLRWVDGDNYRVQALRDLKDMTGNDGSLFNRNWMSVIEPRLAHATMLKQVDLAVAKSLRDQEAKSATAPTNPNQAGPGLFDHLQGDHLGPIERVIDTRAHQDQLNAEDADGTKAKASSRTGKSSNRARL